MALKFWGVVCTFLATSREPLYQFGWNLARLVPVSFSTKSYQRILIPLFVSKLDFFPREGLIYLSSLTSSTNKRRTKALAKNLRHSFLAIGVKKRTQCWSFCLLCFWRVRNLIYEDMYVSKKKTFPFSKHVKLLPLFEYKVIFWDYWAAKKCIVYKVFHKNNKNYSDPSANGPEAWLIP